MRDVAWWVPAVTATATATATPAAMLLHRCAVLYCAAVLNTAVTCVHVHCIVDVDVDAGHFLALL